MKTCLMFIALSVVSYSAVASSQDSEPYDRDTVPRDASYIFNRFEELANGVSVQIDDYPMNIRKNTRDALSAVLQNVNNEKPALNKLLGKTKASSVDLLDVYSEVVEVAAELEDQSSNSLNWVNQKLGIDLEQLGSKATVLGAKLGVVLRTQLAAQESQLASCTHEKTTSGK